MWFDIWFGVMCNVMRLNVVLCDAIRFDVVLFDVL